MAVGTLTVTPQTLVGFPSVNNQASKLFVGCFVRESEKHRTQAVDGSNPTWNDSLHVTVREGENDLNIDLIDERPTNGGIVATAKVALNQVYNLGKESILVALKSSNGGSLVNLQLNLVFNGTNSVSSVASSFGTMNLADGQQDSYQQTTVQSHSTSFSQSDSRQSSFSSLGPANPIPDNYGSCPPPPFTPPAPVLYGGKEAGSGMPGSNASNSSSTATSSVAAGGGLVDANGVDSTATMSAREFEEAKAKGDIPKWAVYGGGAVAAAAAACLTAWGAHELKEHFDKKEDKENKYQDSKQDKPIVPPAGHQQQPYTTENQLSQHYPTPPQQAHNDEKEKKDKKNDKKKDKKKNKHRRGSGSDSSSSSSSSESDSSDDDSKHKKKSDKEWR